MRYRPATILLTVLMAAPALGQDVETVTFFKQFLWTSDLFGLAIIWLLLAMSAASIGYAISLFIRYRRDVMLPDDTQQQVKQFIDQKQYRQAIELTRQDDSFLGRLLRSALNEAANGYPAMERAIHETGDAETAKILRPLEYLNVVGNLAPMLGLFGTVYGMIRAFQQLVATGGNPDPAALAGGISTALVTTFWGLVVAMPALASYALIRNRVDAFTSDGLLIGEQLITTFRPAARRDAAPAPSPADTGLSSRRSQASPKPGRSPRPEKPE